MYINFFKKKLSQRFCATSATGPSQNRWVGANPVSTPMHIAITFITRGEIITLAISFCQRRLPYNNNTNPLLIPQIKIRRSGGSRISAPIVAFTQSVMPPSHFKSRYRCAKRNQISFKICLLFSKEANDYRN